MIYFVLVFFVFLASLSFDQKICSGFDYNEVKSSQEFRVVYGLLFFFVTAIVAFRFKIGDDTIGYALEYPNSPVFSFDILNQNHYYKFQPGWIIFRSLIRSLSGNFLLLQITHAVFVNSVFFWFIRKYSKNAFLSLMIYLVANYLNLNTEVIRESMAVAFGLLAYDALKEKKWVRMCLMSFLAYEFHVSGLVVPLVLLLSVIPDTKLSRLISLAICLSMVTLWALLPDLSLYTELLFSEDYSRMYFSQETNVEYNIIGQIVRLTSNVLIPFLFVCFIPRASKGNISILIITYCLFKSMSIYSIAFERFSNYFVPFYWIGIGEAIYYYYKKSKNRLNYFFLLSGILAVFLYIYGNIYFVPDYAHGYNYVYERYFPYKSVIFDGHY